MLINWNDEFAPHILARGKKYYEENRVSRIHHCMNLFVAEVEGTELYDVEIDTDGDLICDLFCSCPYAQDGENCKHMAAVLYALENNAVVEELPPPYIPPPVSRVPVEMPWMEAVNHLPEEMIRKELMKLLERDTQMQKRLSILFMQKAPEGQMQNWKADLQDIAYEYTNRRGQIDANNAWDFAEELEDFLCSEIPTLMDVGATIDAFHLVWLVMETALEWDVDDCENQMYDLFQRICWLLGDLQEKMSPNEREDMYRWYQEHRNVEWPGGVERVDNIFNDMMHNQN